MIILLLWCTTSKSNLEILQRFYNKVLRIIIHMERWFQEGTTNALAYSNQFVKYLMPIVKCGGKRYKPMNLVIRFDFKLIKSEENFRGNDSYKSNC